MAYNARSYPEQFQGYPAIGAYHEVQPNPRLDDFMESFRIIANQVFIQAHSSTQAAEQPLQILDYEDNEDDEARFRPPNPGESRDYDQISLDAATAGDKLNADMYHHILTWKHANKYYRSYNGTTLGVSVLDGDHSERSARAIRSVWQKQDIGDTKQIARNEIDRRMPETRPRLFMDQIARMGKRLPNAPANHKGRKLALIPNPAEYGSTINMLCEENDIIIEAINKRLKNFEANGEYIPHVTFAWFSSHVSEEQLSQIAGETKELAAKKPVRVNLDPQITFRDRLTRGLSRKG